jgi:hypothetical protein
MLFLNLKKLRYELFYNIKKNNCELIEESLNNYFVEAKKYGIFQISLRQKKVLEILNNYLLRIEDKEIIFSGEYKPLFVFDEISSLVIIQMRLRLRFQQVKFIYPLMSMIYLNVIHVAIFYMLTTAPIRSIYKKPYARHAMIIHIIIVKIVMIPFTKMNLATAEQKMKREITSQNITNEINFII